MQKAFILSVDRFVIQRLTEHLAGKMEERRWLVPSTKGTGSVCSV